MRVFKKSKSLHNKNQHLLLMKFFTISIISLQILTTWNMLLLIEVERPRVYLIDNLDYAFDIFVFENYFHIM